MKVFYVLSRGEAAWLIYIMMVQSGLFHTLQTPNN